MYVLDGHFLGSSSNKYIVRKFFTGRVGLSFYYLFIYFSKYLTGKNAICNMLVIRGWISEIEGLNHKPKITHEPWTSLS